MRKLILLLLLLPLSFTQYQVYIVRANDSAITNLVYDDQITVGSITYNGSYSYKDNSLENPDALLRICAMTAAELQNKYVSLMYADGTNPGDYMEITHFPVQITYVPPNNCVYLQLEISSFRAWYPSIPFVFISNTPDMSAATRVKLLELNGWLVGNYTVNYTQTGNLVNVTVTDALDDTGASIIPDVNYLVVGLMEGSTLTTTDTAITSLNDSVVLSLGSYTGPYYIHINGIGPGLFPPVVNIISPEPITYTTASIPLVYTITTYQGPVDSCWYILDSTTVVLPDCTISYILDVPDGVHTLTLYANDTAGNVGYDSVVFSVATAPPPPPGPFGGPGAPHVGQPPIPPAYEQFEIRPENIRITIDYPLEGSANFSLYSLSGLTGVYCFVRADFEEYTTIELESDSIPAGGTIRGTITVDMPPTTILDYSGSTEGLLQCVGRKEANSTLLLSTSANIYLTINKPLISVENITMELLRGEEKAANLTLTNIGNGSAYAYNLSVEFGGPYGNLIRLVNIPEILYSQESGFLSFVVSIPRDMEPGVYRIPVLIYENGRLVGKGHLTLFVKPEFVIKRCIFPDLRWTVIILVLGAAAAVLIFKREKEKQEKGERIKRAHMKAGHKEEEKNKWDPWLRAFFTALLFLAIWALVVWLLARCTYITI
ncbi:MAG: hypothetical protein AB1657_00010 [Candidatus Micrarchaeota archaeon]